MLRLLGLILFILISLSSSAEDSRIDVGLPRFAENQVNRSRESIVQNPVQLEAPIDSNYVVGPGDYFEILFPTQSQVVQVSPEGKVTIVGVGVAAVSGLSLAQAKKEIERIVSLRTISSKVDIQLVQLKKLCININGAVALNGQIVLESSSRLSSAIRKAGGLLVVADRENILIIRRGDTTTISYDNLEKGNMAADPMLEPGDLVVVPFCDLAKAITLRTADGIMTMPFKEGRDLRYYMEIGNFHRIREPGYNQIVIYPKSGHSRTISMDSARSYVPTLGDEIQFMFKNQFVYVGGATAVMGRIEFIPGWHALDYIAASGVTIITGSWSQVTLIRKGEKSKVDVSNYEIEPGDYIEIPRSYYESVKDVTLFLASLLSVVATFIVIRSY